MKQSVSAFLLAAAASLPSVLAHGYLARFGVNGDIRQSFDYSNKDLDSPVRQTDYLLPMYDVFSPAMACGAGARSSNRIVTAQRGSTLHWGWRTDSESTGKTWTHHEGSTRTFAANCGGRGSCASANANELEWTQIAARAGGPNQWPAEEQNQGQNWVDTIPNYIPDGDYLIRNEMVALHYSTKPHGTAPENGHDWGIEYYPSCAAVRVEGGSSSGSLPNDVVRFPGAYDGNYSAAGRYNPNVFTEGYSLPTLSTFQRTGGGGGGGSDTPTPETPTPETPTPETPSNNTPVNNTPAPTTPNDGTTPVANPPRVCRRRLRKRNAGRFDMKRALAAHRQSSH